MTVQHPSTIDLPALADGDIDAFFEFEDLWAVIVWNDDVTTFQTVIQAFVEIFGHTVERADQLAWTIHRTGKAVAAVRPKDEAEAAVHALHLRKIQATLAAPDAEIDGDFFQVRISSPSLEEWVDDRVSEALASSHLNVGDGNVGRLNSATPNRRLREFRPAFAWRELLQAPPASGSL